jgi:hypothetical protein
MWGRVWSLTCVQLGPSLFWQGAALRYSFERCRPATFKRAPSNGRITRTCIRTNLKLSEQDHKASELDEAE